MHEVHMQVVVGGVVVYVRTDLLWCHAVSVFYCLHCKNMSTVCYKVDENDKQNANRRTADRRKTHQQMEEPHIEQPA